MRVEHAVRESRRGNHRAGCVASVVGAVDQRASDSGLELGGVTLHTRGKASDSALEDRVETEQHDRQEGIEQLRCSGAQTDRQVHEAAAVEQMHASTAYFIPFEMSTQVDVGMLVQPVDID